MNDTREADIGRVLELDIELDADVRSVWDSLTKAAQLQNWFSEIARGDAAEGEVITIGWGDDEWQPRVGVIDRCKRLQWAKTDGSPLVVDFYVDETASGTRLRLVQSGFGDDDSWDEMYDALDAGWAYFLQHLAFYLKHHEGVTRSMHWARHRVAGARDAVWATMLSADGELFDETPDPGVRMTPGMSTIERLSAEWVVFVHKPGRTLGVMIPALNYALMLFELESGKADLSFAIWLSTYNLDARTNGLLRKEVRVLADAMTDLI